MKIIDLLNKIANGEEVPKKIQVYSDIFVLDYDNKVYEHEKTRTNLLNIYNGNILNYKVKIIKEKKKPMKIYWDITDDTYTTTIGDKDYKGNKNNFEELSDMYRQKINEIIDYLKSKGDE